MRLCVCVCVHACIRKESVWQADKDNLQVLRMKRILSYLKHWQWVNSTALPNGFVMGKTQETIEYALVFNTASQGPDPSTEHRPSGLTVFCPSSCPCGRRWASSEDPEPSPGDNKTVHCCLLATNFHFSKEHTQNTIRPSPTPNYPHCPPPKKKKKEKRA